MMGLKDMECFSLNDVRNIISKLKQELKTDKTFKEFYKFIFDYMKDARFMNF